MKIYHNPACSKSRAALSHLQDKYDDLEVIKYLDTPPTAEVISDLMARSNDSAEEFVRWADAKKLGCEIGETTDATRNAQLIANNPKIMQRPLVDTGEQVFICRTGDVLANL